MVDPYAKAIILYLPPLEDDLQENQRGKKCTADNQTPKCTRTTTQQQTHNINLVP